VTTEEKKVIEMLRRVAKIWPATLWIFCDGNGLRIMRRGADGQRQTTSDGAMAQRSIVTTIDIPSDGGDW
jgi:hypothetical protein